MKKPFFTQCPLAIALSFAILAGTTLPVHAQFARETNKTIAVGTTAMRGDVDSVAIVTRTRLAKALPAFWASTAPGQTYMILTTMIRRSIDGSVTSNETSGPYTFNPKTSINDVQINAPEFVALLLGQYATQSRVGLAELTMALQSYFDSTNPGQGTALNGGQVMRNSDGTATFTDGSIIFVFDTGTSALTVATMAPALAAALSNYASSIETGAPAGGYALRDPANANQLINFDGRMYDTNGNALPNASAGAVSALFGNGNGSSRGTASGSSASNSGNPSGLGSSSSANTSNSGSGSGSSNGTSSNSAGSTDSSVGSNTTDGNATSSGSTTSNTNSTSLGGNAPLSVNNATGSSNSNFGSNTQSGRTDSKGGVCQVFRVLGGGGSTSCN